MIDKMTVMHRSVPNMGLCSIKLLLIVGSQLPINCFALDDDVHAQNERLRQQSERAIDSEQQAIIDAASPKKEDIATDSLSMQQQITPETAIFMVINQRNWALLSEMIDNYAQLSDADANFLLFAKATLQAGLGNIDSAIESYQSLLISQPEFVRARLDLARLYYQDGLLKQSQQQFNEVLRTPELPTAVNRNIQAYLTAIHKKQSFNGMIALGAGYELNVNESSESTTCLYQLPDGKCGYTRSTPKAIDSAAVNIETTVSHNWQLRDHHGATFSLLGYGTEYSDKQANNSNNSTVNLSAGYRYQDYDTELSFTPLIEYRREDNKKLYSAAGTRLSYSQNLTQSPLGKLLKHPLRLAMNAEYKDFSYDGDYANNDGDQWSLYSNLYLTTNPRHQWFISADYLDRDNDDKSSAYTQAGIGLGLYKQWENGLISTVVARYRKREHQAYSALLGATREDKQSSLYTNVRMPKLRWYGFEPSISYQYRHNDSNVDWLYDYDASNVWVKMSRVF